MKIHVAVTDGVTIGHPCCGVPKCTAPLSNNRHRFCDGHAEKNLKCAVVACNEDTELGFRTCPDREHRALEDHLKQENKAMFMLKKRLQRLHVGSVELEIAGTGVDNPQDLNELVDDVEATMPDEDFDGRDLAQESEKPKKRSLKNVLGRVRTHNEQLMVRTCGMIIGRCTCYHSESLTQVKVR